MNCLEGFWYWIWVVGVEGASPGRCELNGQFCAHGREVETGDLTKNGNLGRGMPKFFGCWRIQAARGQQKYGCLQFLCPFIKGMVWENL